MKLNEMEFKVPKELEASAPPEARGQPRDHTRACWLSIETAARLNTAASMRSLSI